MSETHKSYRIRTKVGEKTPSVINVNLNQTFDELEILSLKLNQKGNYKFYQSNYGVIVGRVLANGSFGIPNAKISIFIALDETDTIKQRTLYNYSSPHDTDYNTEIRYNLLPDEVDKACHADVGTFPNKRYLLDNNDVIETFEKYWKYTTTTNESGDYMLFGIPTGSQQLHVDVDLSDCGILSQRPTDMIYKGYNVELFDSPTKFKKDTNLNSLAQICSQDRGVYVYPYWGESTENGDSLSITRCDIEIDYKFEPTCVFLGSIVTDKGSNSIGKNCTADQNNGKMADLITGEGRIEMIRKTFDNKIESYQINGNRLINSDGVWCYQIPMNLDYVMTDEYGNIVPTDDPTKGIPTRTRVRFRISLDDAPSDATARKRCRYLVPNNPALDEGDYPKFSSMKSKEADYEFGSSTLDESFRDMFWNKVYTVKNYIPRLQKNTKTTNRKHTGIKLINHYGDNNPMPYNSLSIKLSFTYRLICVLTKVIIYIIEALNIILGTITTPFCSICKILKGLGHIPLIGSVFNALKAPFCAMTISCIKLSSEFCDDGINKYTYYPGCWGCEWSETKSRHNKEQASLKNTEERTVATNSTAYLMTCVENSLAQENDCTSFNFQNDWINGVLYAPLWYRRITKKRTFLFGLFKRKAKDQWCDANKIFNMRMYQACSVPVKNDNLTVKDTKGNKAHESIATQEINHGLILTRETILGETVYYYRAMEYDSSEKVVKTLFATDIVLLGSLNDYDLDGVPSFYKYLESSTFKIPTDILFTDTTIAINDSGESVTLDTSTFTEATGCDWGNLNSFDECGKMGSDYDGGLFYGIGCSNIEMRAKSCVNLRRICEFGVELDTKKSIPNLASLESSESDSSYDELIPDGFISHDELEDVDARSMFATMNGNHLRTEYNEATGLRKYKFIYMYPTNFDGALKSIMTSRLSSCSGISYYLNNKLEEKDQDYVNFRMGIDSSGKTKDGYYRDKTNENHILPKYENSFYFYFGLKSGKTAIDKFNKEYYSVCTPDNGEESNIGIITKSTSWCDLNNSKSYVAIDVTDITTPYDIIINSLSDSSYSISESGIMDEKIYFSRNELELSDENDDSSNSGELTSDYVWYPIQNKGLPDGTYELTITDGNGDIVTTRFVLSKDYLSYQTQITNFDVANNIKFTDATYNNNRGYSGIENTVITKYGKDDDIGGYILLYNISNGDDTENYYRVSITAYENGKSIVLSGDFSGNYTYKGHTFTIKVDSNGSILSYQKSSGDSANFLKIVNLSLLNDSQKNGLLIAVPKGDITYRLKVTQLCSKTKDTNNITITYPKISDPLPFNLYINGINYKVFKEGNFDTGWTGKEKLKKKVCGNICNLKGWNKLSDESLYDWEYAETVKNWTNMSPSEKVTYFENNFYENSDYEIAFLGTSSDTNVLNWDELTDDQKAFCFTDLSNFSSYIDAINYYTQSDYTDNSYNALGDEEKDNIVDWLTEDLFYSIYNASLTSYFKNVALKEMDEIIKKEFITEVKGAFYQTCENDGKTISYSASTSHYPVTFYTFYSEEETTDDSYVNIITSDGGWQSNVVEDTDLISDVLIPNITHVTNKNYGKGKTCNNGSISYGKDKNDYYKRPYYVAVQDSKGNCLPITAKSKKERPKMFAFMIIDKGLEFKMLAWSYFNSIPYYITTEISNDLVITLNKNDKSTPFVGAAAQLVAKIGKYISANGLLCGYIYNGITTESENMGKLVYFDTQTYLNKDLNIYTLNISGNNEDAIPTKRILLGEKTDSKYRYSNYIVNEINSGEYSSYPQYIEVPNKEEDVNIEDSSCTLTKTVYGKMKLTLGNNFHDSTKKDKKKANYINITASNGDSSETYIVIQLDTSNSTTKKRFYPLNNFVQNDDGSFYYQGSDYGVLAYDVTLDDLKTKDWCDTKIQGIETNDDESTTTYNGYCTSGYFKAFKNDTKYFVVAVTDNNCRAISPVYDFTKVEVKYELVESEGSYTFKVKVTNVLDENKVHLYYLYAYTFDVNINLPFLNSPIDETVTLEKLENKYSEFTSMNGDIPDVTNPKSDIIYYIDKGENAGVERYEQWKYVNAWTSTSESGEIDDVTDYEQELEEVKPELEEGKSTAYIRNPYDATLIFVLYFDDEGNFDYAEEVTNEDIQEDWQDITEESEGKTYRFYVDKTCNDEVDETAEDTDSSTERPCTKYLYSYYEYKFQEWIKVGAIENDPGIQHYEKYASITLSKEDYNVLKNISKSILKKLLDNYSSITVTDCTGLIHKPIIK
jgi:hypothetical protein